MRASNCIEFHDVHADHHDLDGARSWMSIICGPHSLRADVPRHIQFHYTGNRFKSMSTTLGHIEYGTDVTIGVEDIIQLNCYSISLPVSGQQELSKDGERHISDQDTGLIISPDQHQQLTIGGNCRKMQVAIERNAMRSVLESMLERKIDKPLQFASRVEASNGGTGSWWRMVRYFMDEMESARDLFQHTAFSRDMETALIKGLILAQPSNYTDELHSRYDTRLPHYLLRARQFIHDHARDNLCLEDIEQAAGVSRFKLFDAFKQHAGMSPMAYLKKYRLECARRAILEDFSTRNVSAIAMEWGFSHLGRFASDYRKLFGESPSETAQRFHHKRLS
ncbi:AraC family transcriptional regulator [Pokkaliibacter plantistimulans]|uniref:AraC family transcriptional regulator n=2 Tax=Pseudomonadota TaxID=1224 RepID=A0ABX5LPM1_9GAMM|nr:AraC family transcriptional regulator [Pokkaliibacter plantistimulans]PXF28609.1 AraC family transcriptional regulator [Pokkaliibacter plantistimulans]